VPAREVQPTAIAEARRLGQFSAKAYAATKRAQRQAIVDRTMSAARDESERFFVDAG
jgi:hypothetical protein